MSTQYDDMMGANTDYSTHDEKVVPILQMPNMPKSSKEDSMDNYKMKERIK